jgi:hypothetical protein
MANKGDIMWKPIKSLEGYEASSDGDIRSIDRKVSHCDGNGERILRGRILKKTISNVGYYYVSASLGGKAKKYTVHRLVCLAFNGESNGLTVNHKNGNKLDNSHTNLEWVGQSENNKHAYDKLKKKPAGNMLPGSGHATFKSPIEALKDGKSFMMYGAKDIRANGFLSQSVYACVNGKLKTHKGYTFRRVYDEAK